MPCKLLINICKFKDKEVIQASLLNENFYVNKKIKIISFKNEGTTSVFLPSTIYSPHQNAQTAAFFVP